MKKMQKKCRLCRREGVKLFLKGDRCSSQKCSLQKRNYPPGFGPEKRFSKTSDYGRQLRQKQKARRIFGISEKTLFRYYRVADRSNGITGDEMLRLLETRIDNAIFKAGFAESRAQARQFVSHKIFLLNGTRVNVPSIQIKPGDTIEVSNSNKKMPVFEKLKKSKIKPARWVDPDFSKLIIEIKDLPEKEDFDISIDTQPIVEFYSR